jgi:hypothetical protein
MSQIVNARSASLRIARLRALAPRALFYVAMLVLVIAGLRAAIEGPAKPAILPLRPMATAGDLGERSFAEAFARAYLTWDDADPELHAHALAPYLSSDLDADGGLSPAPGSSQGVIWTTVLGAHSSGQRDIVTIAAQTTRRLVYLSVPITRDARSFLAVSGYPAFVGPPATTNRPTSRPEDEVEDPQLKAVVERAVTNYLARANRNLLADLTPGAVVSLPPQALDVKSVDTVTWVKAPGRVAAEVAAVDDNKDTWTLRYELDVLKRDRWYVRSVEIDPTFKGGGS